MRLFSELFLRMFLSRSAFEKHLISCMLDSFPDKATLKYPICFKDILKVYQHFFFFVVVYVLRFLPNCNNFSGISHPCSKLWGMRMTITVILCLPHHCIWEASYHFFSEFSGLQKESDFASGKIVIRDLPLHDLGTDIQIRFWALSRCSNELRLLDPVGMG